MKLNRKQKKPVKKPAKNLLEILKSKTFTAVWRERLPALAQPVISIEPTLDETLPKIRGETKFQSIYRLADGPGF